MITGKAQQNYIEILEYAYQKAIATSIFWGMGVLAHEPYRLTEPMETLDNGENADLCQ
jgi:hypothetical protein